METEKEGFKLKVMASVIGIAVLALVAFSMMPSGGQDAAYLSPEATPTTIPAGRLLIVEYSDFKCPYCANAAETVEQLRGIYGDKIYVDFRHFPLSFHKGADLAAQASECARDQGMFWEYHDALFAASKVGTDVGKPENLKAIASQTGLERQGFDSCLDTQAKKQVVDADIREASAKGVTGTPTFYVAGTKMVGAQPIEVFQKTIESKLGAKDE